MKITVYHTAFAHHNDSIEIATREFSQPKEATVTDVEELLEFTFAATNAPPEHHSAAMKTFIDYAKNEGRVYSQSVGDLVLIEAKNCRALYITAGVGFKLIDAGKGARRSLNDLIATWVLEGCERNFWSDFARLHEEPPIDPIEATEKAFAKPAA